MEQAAEKSAVPRHRKALGELVSKTRKAHGLTQAALTERLATFGMTTHPTSVAKIEAGTRGVTLDELVSLSSALGWESSALEDVLAPPGPERDARIAVVDLRESWQRLVNALTAIRRDRRRVQALIDRDDMPSAVRATLRDHLESENLKGAIEFIEMTDAYAEDGDDVEHQEA